MARRSLTDWWQHHSALQHDLVFYAVLTLAGTVNSAATGTLAQPLNLLLLLLGPAPVLWRRQRPGLNAGTAGRCRSPATEVTRIAAAATASATVLDALRLDQPQVPADFVFGTLGTGLAVGLGVLLRRHRAALVELAARNAELEELRVADARRAVIEDRARIARDLHDVVAHHVSAIAVRANAGRHVADRQPEQAVAALDYVAGAASETLTALRRMVAVLRADQDPAPHPGAAADFAPQLSLNQLSALITEVNTAGGRVELHEHGVRRQLPADVEVAVYRVIQEGLTNALRHAPRAAVLVELQWERGQLRITITNGPPEPGSGDVVREPSTGGGHGLLGMRERLALCGGEVAAGSHGPGWRVRALVATADTDPTHRPPAEWPTLAPEARRGLTAPQLQVPG